MMEWERERDVVEEAMNKRFGGGVGDGVGV